MSDDKDIDDIGCIEAINALYAYLDGELDDPREIALFEHHMSHCRACFSRTELETALSEHIKRSARDRAPDRLKNRLRKLIDHF